MRYPPSVTVRLTIRTLGSTSRGKTASGWSGPNRYSVIETMTRDSSWPSGCRRTSVKRQSCAAVTSRMRES